MTNDLELKGTLKVISFVLINLVSFENSLIALKETCIVFVLLIEIYCTSSSS